MSLLSSGMDLVSTDMGMLSSGMRFIRLIPTFVNYSAIKVARPFSTIPNYCKMSTYTTVEKGAPNSTDFRIFYRKCILTLNLVYVLLFLLLNLIIVNIVAYNTF